MARIVIVGSGIIGMATAAMLSRQHTVIIVARDLPGDAPSIEWASPWAGANYIAGHAANAAEKQMQLDAFQELWRMSIRHPESGVKQLMIKDVFNEIKTEEDLWWSSLPEFRYLQQDELPEGAKMGISYRTVVCNPDVFLPWYRNHLEKIGVAFQRMTLKSLSDTRILHPDVIINATGAGSRDLTDVKDPEVEKVRGQTIIVKSDFDQVLMRDDGKAYTYAISRMDGTTILGGVRQVENVDPTVDWDVSQDIVNRLHKSWPNIWSNNLADYDIVGHNVGIRPGRKSGVRVEKEIKNGLNVVHAYGFSNGGYIYSFGAARVAASLADELLFPKSKAKL